jgi:DNA modification methylase
LNPISNLVTICTTDRKGDGKIYPKHIKVIGVFEKNGWFLKSKKIWVKSYKVNMFRMNYMNILTFARKPFKVNNPHDPDVILDEKTTNVDGFKFGMSLLVCKTMIENHTKENDVIYDPFMGSGTTAVAALECGRTYLGSEINGEYLDLCEKRINTNIIQFVKK